MAKKLLITGFDPFGGETVNPAWEAVKLLPSQIGSYTLEKLQIPTVFGKAAETVLQTAHHIQPDLILCIGQAGGRNAVTPERIAVNIRDAKTPDNAGVIAKGERIIPHGPAAYFSTVDVETMAAAAQNHGYPSQISNSAGCFVCNDLFYSLLHHYAQTQTAVGFIHVPWLPQQGTPSLPVTQVVSALTAMIESL